MNKNKVNISINGIEKKAVDILNKSKEEKRVLLKDTDVLNKLKNFIFGKSSENPLQHITDKVEEEFEILRNKVDKLAKTEKSAYLGKSKKTIKGIKKVADEISKEVL